MSTKNFSMRADFSRNDWRSDSDISLYSFYGGFNTGKCLQIRIIEARGHSVNPVIANGSAYLTRNQVESLRNALTQWLENN